MTCCQYTYGPTEPAGTCDKPVYVYGGGQRCMTCGYFGYGGPGPEPPEGSLAVLMRYVRQRMGVPEDDDFFTEGVLIDAINQAVATIEEEHYWPWAERVEQVTVTSGTLPKPARWRATRSLHTATGDELHLVALSDFLSWGSATGAPRVWTDAGDDIVLAPIPSSVELVHAYYRAAPVLVMCGDLPDQPASVTGAVVAKAAELLSAREDDQTARAAHQGDYAKWLDRMRRDQRRSTGPLKVRVRSGGWI